MPAKNIFQIRRGTSAQWNTANPVLASGELGYDTDTKVFKIGDGSTQWNSLESASNTGLVPEYPIRAYLFSGMFILNNSNGTWNRSVDPKYFWNQDLGDVRIAGEINYPDTSITVDYSPSITKALQDYPGTYLHYASIEVALVDAHNRIVGWGVSATDTSVGVTHGTTGYALTINLFDFPDWSLLPGGWTINNTSGSTNSAAYLFNRPTPYKHIDPPETSVFYKGLVSGPITIDGDKSIQIMSMNGTSTTFTKGNYWYGSKEYSKDVVLKLNVSSPTSINWTIVNEWYNQAPSGPLSIGTHQFLLRLIDQTTIEGHYIGVRTLPSP